MNTQIFYFSGTGNSLHIARELAGKIPNTSAIPMLAAVNSRRLETEAETVGFVFPIHAFTIPGVVKQFLLSVDLKSASYIFAVATRGGSPCRVFAHMDKILEKKGKALDAQFFVNMPNNYIPAFNAPSEEEITRLEAEAQTMIAFMAEIISKRQKSKEKDPHGSFMEENVLFPLLTPIFHKTGYFNLQNGFYADSGCTGCGTCSQVCLSGKIGMQEGRPQWDKSIGCTYCLACIHYCPTRAIQLKKAKSESKSRYHHKNVAMKDIAAQKTI